MCDEYRQTIQNRVDDCSQRLLNKVILCVLHCLLLVNVNVCRLFVLQRWNPSLQAGYQEAASARDASQRQDQWPGYATPLSSKSYFLKFRFLS